MPEEPESELLMNEDRDAVLLAGEVARSPRRTPPETSMRNGAKPRAAFGFPIGFTVPVVAAAGPRAVAEEAFGAALPCGLALPFSISADRQAADKCKNEKQLTSYSLA